MARILAFACSLGVVLSVLSCGESDAGESKASGGAAGSVGSGGGGAAGSSASGGGAGLGASGGTSGGGTSSAGGTSGAGGSAGAGGAGGASAGCPSSSAVVMCVDFDQTALGDYTQASFDKDWPSSKWEQGLGTGRASIIDGADAWSGRSLRVKYPKGTFGPSDNAAQFWITLPKSYDELFVAYRVRFEPGFDFVQGGKLPGLLGGKGNTGGEKPTGADGWSGRMMWRKNGGMVQYLYHPDQPTIYGEDLPWDVGGVRKFVPGTWSVVEHRIVMNTPGQKNGVVQGWLDGVLALDQKAIRFRDVSTFAIDAFYFSTFFGGADATWAPPEDVYIAFDDFVISTGPITH